MILLLAVSIWMLLLWLATGLCAAARLGDRTRIEAVSGDLGPTRRGPEFTGSSLRARSLGGKWERGSANALRTRPYPLGRDQDVHRIDRHFDAARGRPHRAMREL
jgi:hypothetical protein